MWTPETRIEHDREDLRYPSDLTDAEWRVLEPWLPPPTSTGRHRSWPLREVMNAIFYILRGGISLRMLPEHFPPHQTVYRWLTRFRDYGTWEGLNHRLVALDRESIGREAGPIALVIATQSVKTTEACGPNGYDAAKKIKGRERHALVEKAERPLEIQVHAAWVQDRDGAPSVLRASHGRFPSTEKVFADSVYTGERVANATAIAVEIVLSCRTRWASGSCRSAGWLGDSSRGSTATGDSPRISKAPSPLLRRFSTLPASYCWPGVWLVPHEIRVRL